MMLLMSTSCRPADWVEIFRSPLPAGEYGDEGDIEDPGEGTPAYLRSSLELSGENMVGDTGKSSGERLEVGEGTWQSESGKRSKSKSS